MRAKELICAAAGVVGSIVAGMLGGWDGAIATLLVFMGIDLVSGVIIAGAFRASPKTATGALNSNSWWRGLAKKAMTLLFVLIGHRLDLTIGTDYIRNTVIIGFIANELVSIVENAGIMGLPLPNAITKAIDILQSKEKDSSGTGGAV